MDGRIARTLVHKTSEDAVLIGRPRRLQGHRWEFDAELPRNASAQDSGGIPTLLGVELMRQAAIAYAHLQGGVPLDWALLMNELSFGWLREVPGNPGSPLAGRIAVSTLAVQQRNGLVSGLELEACFLSGNALLGAGRGRLSCLSRTAYRAIRRNAPAVDRTSEASPHSGLSEVRRQGDELHAALAWSWDDPLVFDHFSDHLPGILLAHGMLDAHRMLTGFDAGQMDITCENFGEFNAPAEVLAFRSTADETRILISQLGRTLATGACRGSRSIYPVQPLLTLDSPGA
ncbi:AfsA-related hotdog domain-containing protein [Arthrobacter silvisoli]|uniref:AfsA-related hotdog domain-containing protein n=1 Tax=Arthrobacter silvisoli TaxID=2291022 RepID=UPI000E21729E|nr:AfsA-related hotdog domain-containing protein [Arthrobacter silvisoli]